MHYRLARFLVDALLPGMRSIGTVEEIGIRVAAIAQVILLSGIYLAIKQKKSNGLELDKFIYAWIYSQLVLIIASYAIQ